MIGFSWFEKSIINSGSITCVNRRTQARPRTVVHSVQHVFIYWLLLKQIKDRTVFLQLETVFKDSQVTASGKFWEKDLSV